MKRMISMVVKDHVGVLSRITAVLNRRQVNIDSISVGPTETPGLSRMTIMINAETLPEVEQVTKQLNKQVSVLKVRDITTEPHLERELALVKVNAPVAIRSEIKAVIDPFRADIVDVGLKNIVRNIQKIQLIQRIMKRYYRRKTPFLSTLYNLVG